MVGRGPLFDCVDLYHSLNCQKYCHCTAEALRRSQFFISKVTNENIFKIFSGVLECGNLIKIEITLKTLLKALIFHYNYCVTA